MTFFINSAGEAWLSVPVISFQLPALNLVFWTNPWGISILLAVLFICVSHIQNHDLALAGVSAISSLRLAISSFWATQTLERVHMKWRSVFYRGGHSIKTSNRLIAAWVFLSKNQRKTTAVWITVVFFVLVASNSFGLVPLFSAITGQAGTTLGLSFALWTAVTLVGIERLRGRFVKLFLPGGLNWQMVPIFVLLESISYSFRAISLGVRLFSNMLAGHQLIHLVSALTLAPALCAPFIIGAPVTVLAAGLLMGLSGLEAIVCVLQSGVFCLLAGSYLEEALSKQDPLAQPSNYIIFFGISPSGKALDFDSNIESSSLSIPDYEISS
jgi:ATP synthase subunit 6